MTVAVAWTKPRLALGLAALLCGLLLACDAREATFLEVEYAGCKSVLEGPVCVLGSDRTISIWIADEAEEPVVIEADGGALLASPTPIQLGLRYELDLGQAERELVVRRGAATWTLALSPPDEPAWRVEAAALIRGNQAEEARPIVESALKGADAERGRALSVMARIENFAKRIEPTLALLEQAIADHRSRGRVLDAHRDAFLLAFLLFSHKNDLAGARRVLDSVSRDSDLPAEAACDLAINQALLAIRVGDLRTGLRTLTEAADRAARFDLPRHYLNSIQILVPQLWRAGRRRQAADLVAKMHGLTEDYQACERARFLNNTVGWTSILALEAGEEATDPTPVLEQVLKTFDRQCLHITPFNVRINLALAHLHAGRWDSVRALLEEIRRLGPVPELRYMLWILEIEARMALARGKPDQALDAYQRLQELAIAGLSPDIRWRGALGRARALASLGRRPEALKALAEAERQLDQGSQLVPLIDQARASYVAQREEGLRFYLDLLLADGRKSEAFNVARRSRARVVRGLLRQERLTRLPVEEQQRWDQMVSAYRARRGSLDLSIAGDWRLTRDQLRRNRLEREAEQRELSHVLDDALAILDRANENSLPIPAPRQGELLLLYHPLVDGWGGFAHDGVQLTTVRLACNPEEFLASEERLGDCLLAPFAELVRRTPRLRLLPYGALRQVDFHALRLAGNMLIDLKPIVYGLDLPVMAGSPLAEPARALVVADPGGDLPAARREARMVEQVLTAQTPPWELESLRGSAASGQAVRERLAGVNLLHYAGHATFDESGAWESALPLAHGSRLTLGDILTMPDVPRWVVLSGCETGRGEANGAMLGAVETVGLAHAFLVTGSQGVVAATRPVADVETAELLSAFYREWSGGKNLDLALRAAQLYLRQQMPGADWSAFRVLEF